MLYRFIIILTILLQQVASAQDITSLVLSAKQKLDKVNDYVAVGSLKTNVAFLKLPIANIKLYFKKPNSFKMVSEKGVSFVPKESMSINLNGLLNDNNFTIIDAGSEVINKVKVRVAKLLPNDDQSELVLITLYINPLNALILESKTTTKENGTYELKMKYGRYANWSLPDEIVFLFNAKDYKLPKGITFDFDDGNQNKPSSKTVKNKKGEVKLVLTKYSINEGVSVTLFK